jgi:hypothetical protein
MKLEVGILLSHPSDFLPGLVVSPTNNRLDVQKIYANLDKPFSIGDVLFYRTTRHFYETIRRRDQDKIRSWFRDEISEILPLNEIIAQLPDADLLQELKSLPIEQKSILIYSDSKFQDIVMNLPISIISQPNIIEPDYIEKIDIKELSKNYKCELKISEINRPGNDDTGRVRLCASTTPDLSEDTYLSKLFPCFDVELVRVSGFSTAYSMLQPFSQEIDTWTKKSRETEEYVKNHSLKVYDKEIHIKHIEIDRTRINHERAKYDKDIQILGELNYLRCLNFARKNFDFKV